jgi:aspartyl-tRNA(Asn)/glutamyl-tRNA(Gln) amidotransferase subunit B
VLVSDFELVRYFEAAATNPKLGKKIANWVINNVLGILNEKGLTPDQCPVRPEAITGLIAIIDDGTVSNNQAKDVFQLLWDHPELTPAQAAKQLGFEKADTSFLDAIVDEVVANNPDKVAEIVGGNEKLLNWLTGQVMKAAKGKANPKMVTEALRAKLGLA